MLWGAHWGGSRGATSIANLFLFSKLILGEVGCQRDLAAAQPPSVHLTVRDPKSERRASGNKALKPWNREQLPETSLLLDAHTHKNCLRQFGYPELPCPLETITSPVTPDKSTQGHVAQRIQCSQSFPWPSAFYHLFSLHPSPLSPPANHVKPAPQTLAP